VAYNNQLKDAPFDPEKAKALLSKAGFRNGLELSLWAMPVQRPYNSNAQLMAHPAFNALIVKARSTLDVQERSKLYEQA
jgi:ABC-type transport system substrate-binding protein